MADRFPAGRVAKGGIVVGGALWVDDEFLLFQPRGAERLLGRRPLTIPFPDIVEVGIAPRSWRKGTLAAVRRRLFVRTAEAEHLFAMNGLDRCAAVVSDAVERSRRST